jgi:hypothetical protein
MGARVMRILVTHKPDVEKAQRVKDRIQPGVIPKRSQRRIWLEKEVADFNFLNPFLDYLEKTIEDKHMNDTEAKDFIKKEMGFWKAVIGYQSGMGSILQFLRTTPFYMFKDGYVFSTGEFKDLFKYCTAEGTNPNVKFGLQELIDNNSLKDFYLALSQEQKMLIETLVDKFRVYIETKRKEKGLIQYKYPISKWLFHFFIYPVHYIIKALKTPFKPDDLTESDKAQIKVASRFWKLSII